MIISYSAHKGRHDMKTVIITAFVFFTAFTTPPAACQEAWVGKDGSIRSAAGRAFLVNEEAIYLATKNEIYRTQDSAGRWDSIFFIPRGENEINCIAGRSGAIFVGTKRGLYKSGDGGATWRNVFKSILPEKNNILAIEITETSPEKVIIGTGNGIFMSEDKGARWMNLGSNLKNRIVKCLASSNGSIYAGTDAGLYVNKDPLSGWERLLIKNRSEGAEENIETSDLSEERDKPSAINCIVIKDNKVYIANGKGIFYSEDNGKFWKEMPREGLTGTINNILLSAEGDRIWCATTKGVFEFSKERARWLELYKGFKKSADVVQIVFDNGKTGSLWALTDKGLYKFETGRYAADNYVDVEKSIARIRAVFDGEPTFQELQEAAIRFAEVSPEKIRRWRNEAKLKALLPKVSFGMDKDRATNAEIYTSATRDYTVIGPDDISDGWDISVSWELGDLIWSDDQTNIDVRSRLMVQLRNDILDDLRRAYYERKRLQFELMTEPPEGLKARFDKETRLSELTSQIDDLTGNYLSEELRNPGRQ